MIPNDVKRIAQIEESALPSEKQDVIRYCTLQIARLAGENEKDSVSENVE